MEWIRKILEENTNPIIQLINEKESLLKQITQQQENVPDFFAQLPILEKSQIVIIENNLKNEIPLSEAFEHYKEIFVFQEEKLTFLYQQIENKETCTNFAIISVMYSLLSFAIHSELKKEQDSFALILSVLNNHRLKNYDQVLTILFISIINNYLNDDDYKWTSITLSLTSQYFVLTRDIQQIPNSLFFGILEKSIQNEDKKAYKSVFDALNQILIEKKNYFSQEQQVLLLTMIDPYIKSLDKQSLRILSLMSSSFNSQYVKDNFIVISSIYISQLFDQPVFITHEMFPSFEVPKTQRSPFTFHECDPKDFEIGFSPIKRDSVLTEKPGDDFLSVENFEEIQKLSEAISIADSVCIDCFFTSLIKTSSSYTDNDHFYDLIMNIIFLISSLSEITSLMQVSHFFMSKIIFDPGFTIFHHNVTDVVKFIRSEIITILAKSAPSLIGDLIIKTSEFPFLCSEVFARIIYSVVQIEYRNFTSEECLKAISYTISCLWNCYDEDDNSKHAFHTAMSFVFQILSNEAAEKDCFGSLSFAKTFISLCTEKTLLKTIFVTIRNFLSDCGNERVDSLCLSISNVYQKCKTSKNSERSYETAHELGDMIIFSLTHNLQIANHFNAPLDSLLEFALIKTSEKAVQQILRILSLLSQAQSYFHLPAKRMKRLVDVIHTVQSEQALNQIFLALINLCGCSNSLTEESLFLFRNYTFLPVFITGFGSTSLSKKIIPYLMKQCKFSPSNCRMIHASGVDTILFDYILCKDEKKTVNFRGFTFPLDLFDIEEVFSFLWIIEKEQSSNSIALQNIRLMIEPPNLEMASRILQAQVYETTMKRMIEFPLGTKRCFATLFEVPSIVFNKAFSFIFYLKIDSPALTRENKTLTILRIYNDTQTFHLFLSRNTLYYSFDNEQRLRELKEMQNGDELDQEQLNVYKSTPQTALSTIQNNQWCFVAFVVQRYSEDKSAAALYTNGTMIFCHEVPCMQFTIKSSLTFEFGGNGDGLSTNLATLGTFGINKAMLPENVLELISKQGDDPFTYDNGYFFSSTMIDKALPLKVKTNVGEKTTVEVEGEFYFSKEPTPSLHAMFGRGNHLMAFIKCFDPDTKQPQGFLEIIIGLFKFVLGNSRKAQKRFRGFSLIGHLLQKKPEQLTYQMYSAFYSIIDVLDEKQCCSDLFDGIICNAKLWYSTPFFSRIVHHWINIAVTQCPTMFKRKNFFQYMLKTFNQISNIDKNNNQKLHNYFAVLLDQCGRLYLSSKDFDSLFTLLTIYHEKNQPFCIIILNLIEDFAPKFADSSNIEASENVLLSLLSSDNIDICISSLKCLYKFRFPKCLEIMLPASIQLSRHPLKKNIFDALASLTAEYPFFYSLCCILSLSLQKESQDLCSTMLHGLACLLRGDNVTVEKYSIITDDKYWYIWPIIFMISTKDERYQQAFRFLLAFASLGKDKMKEVLIFIQLLSGLLKVETNYIAIQLLENYHGFTEKELAKICYRIVFFRFCDISIDPILLETYEHSPFFDEKYIHSFLGFTSKIEDVLGFDNFFHTNIDDFDLRFGINVSENVSYNEKGILDTVCNFKADFDVIPPYHALLKEVTKRTKAKDSKPRYLDIKDTAENNKYIAKKYKDAFVDMYNEINSINSSAKSRFSQSQTIVESSHKVARTNSGMNPLSDTPLNPKVVDDYLHYMTSSHLESSVVEQSDHLVFGYTPSLTHLVYKSRFTFIDKNSLFMISDIDYSERNIFSFPAEQIMFGEKYPVCVFFGNEKMQVISTQSQMLTLTKKNIEFVIPRNPNSVEIFTKQNESLYFNFSPLTTNEIFEHIKSINPQLIIHPSEILQNLFKEKPKWSNFEATMLVEMFTGKSIHTPNSVPCMRINDTELTFDKFCFYNPHFEKADDIQEIVKNRESLEKLDLSAEIKPLLGQSELYTMKQNSETKEYKFGLGMLRSEFLDSIFFGNKYFAVFSTNGQVKIFEVHQQSVSQRVKYIYTLPESFDLTSNEECVTVIDRKLRKLTKINHKTITTEDMNFLPDMYEAMNETVVRVKHSCEVHTNNIKCFIPEKISCLALSAKNGLFAAGTENCHVFLHSSVRNEFFARIETECEPVKLIITECFNAIVIDTDGLLSIHTIHGQKVGEIKVSVVSWASFSISSFDYVLFSDQSHNIWIFMALSPDEAKIIGKTEDTVRSLSYVEEFDQICAVSSSGRFYMFPLQL